MTLCSKVIEKIRIIVFKHFLNETPKMKANIHVVLCIYFSIVSEAFSILKSGIDAYDIDELKYNKFPHKVSNDAYTDPCKGSSK